MPRFCRIIISPRKSLRWLVLPAIVLPVKAAVFHVAPNGSDTNPGTVASPFATIQRAQEAASPGDTVLIRGGTYQMTEAQIVRKAMARTISC